jgi:hypothetical protein
MIGQIRNAPRPLTLSLAAAAAAEVVTLVSPCSAAHASARPAAAAKPAVAGRG